MKKLFILFSLLPMILHAGIIMKHSGDKLEDITIISETETEITYIAPDGQEASISKSEVSAVLYDDGRYEEIQYKQAEIGAQTEPIQEPKEELEIAVKETEQAIQKPLSIPDQSQKESYEKQIIPQDYSDEVAKVHEETFVEEHHKETKKEYNASYSNNFYDEIIANEQALIIKGSMSKKEYGYFLQNNCPQAYAKYKSGRSLVKGGWASAIVGLVFLSSGIAMMKVAPVEYDYWDDYAYRPTVGKIGIGLLVGGVIGVAASVPMLTLGYINLSKADKIYGSRCASSNQNALSFNLTTGQNGLGIAMVF